jgi:hypothetical protein
MEGYERKNKKEIYKELQDLDPIGSPHTEEILIGGNVDLDLISLFPQKDARIMGGMRRKGKLFKVNNGGERKWKSQPPNEEEGALYSPRMKSDRYRIFNPEIPASGAEFLARGQNFCPPYKISTPPIMRVAPQLEKKDLAKFRRGGNYGISAPRKFRPRGQNFRPRRKHQYENGCNFCIWTPFSMNLGSLESPQRAIQLYP